MSNVRALDIEIWKELVCRCRCGVVESPTKRRSLPPA